MVRYDSSVIVQFVQSLYDQANSMLIIFTISGVVIGGGGGSLISTEAAVIGAVVVGFIGYMIGQTRAFQLKLQAQLALCQLAFEENTRKLAEGKLSISEQIALPTSGTAQIPAPSSYPPPVIKLGSITPPSRSASGSRRNCRECGTELPRVSEFCPKCLAPVA